MEQLERYKKEAQLQVHETHSESVVSFMHVKISDSFLQIEKESLIFFVHFKHSADGRYLQFFGSF